LAPDPSDPDIAELLQIPDLSPPVPQATREQKVAAFQRAQFIKDNLPHRDVRVERIMVRHMDDAIAEAQKQQIITRGRTNGLSVAPTQMQAYQWILDYQEDQLRQAIARRRREELAAAAEVLRTMGISFQEVATAFTSVFKDAGDAMIAALRPLLDLLDEGEAIPRQPVCPSHACAMRGGRCPRCDRRRR
jgi:hypothetical protein